MCAKSEGRKKDRNASEALKRREELRRREEAAREFAESVMLIIGMDNGDL